MAGMGIMPPIDERRLQKTYTQKELEEIRKAQEETAFEQAKEHAAEERRRQEEARRKESQRLPYATMRMAPPGPQRVRMDLGSVENGRAMPSGKITCRDGRAFADGMFRAPTGAMHGADNVSAPMLAAFNLTRDCADDASVDGYLSAMGLQGGSRCPEGQAGGPASVIEEAVDLTKGVTRFYLDTDLDAVAAMNKEDQNAARVARGLPPRIDRADRPVIPVKSMGALLDGRRGGMDLLCSGASQAYLLAAPAGRADVMHRSLMPERKDMAAVYDHILGEVDGFLTDKKDDLARMGVSVWEDSRDGHMKAGISDREGYMADRKGFQKGLSDLFRDYTLDNRPASQAALDDAGMSEAASRIRHGIDVQMVVANDGKIVPRATESVMAYSSAIRNAVSVTSQHKTYEEAYGAGARLHAANISEGLDDRFPTTVPALGHRLPAQASLQGDMAADRLPGLDYEKSVRNLGVCTMDDVRDHFNTCAREFSVAAEAAGTLPSCLALQKDGRLTLTDPSAILSPSQSMALQKFGTDMNLYLSTKNATASVIYVPGRKDPIKNPGTIGAAATHMDYEPREANGPTQELFSFTKDLELELEGPSISWALDERYGRADKEDGRDAYRSLSDEMVQRPMVHLEHDEDYELEDEPGRKPRKEPDHGYDEPVAGPLPGGSGLPGGPGGPRPGMFQPDGPGGPTFEVEVCPAPKPGIMVETYPAPKQEFERYYSGKDAGQDRRDSPTERLRRELERQDRGSEGCEGPDFGR